ncbi:MAG: hypothetical protein KDJ88_06395 [Bauldia sp.]|nr:hypothetical protein [Bauldia sp.]
MTTTAFRPLAAVACCAAFYCGLLAPVQAGPIADQAKLSETLLGRGYDSAALSAFSKAAAAFWDASPLQLRTVVFADKVEGYANYTPRANSVFRNNDTLRIYFEPVGFAFKPDGDGFSSTIAADLQIRTPGGLILATSEDFGRLHWQGRSKMHEVQATIEFPLPDFKPGEYQLLLTLRDEGSPKKTTVTLPFSVAE